MHYLILDLETTGIPKRINGKYPNYRDNNAYDASRIVSCAWIIMNEEQKQIYENYFVIKPDGFEIPQEAINIHKITNEYANENGIEMYNVLHTLKESVKYYASITLVAHNLYFDFNILLNALYRQGEFDLINKFFKMQRYCTMFNAKQKMKLKKNPKLVDLYKIVTNTDMENSHNALSDVVACGKCFIYLQDLQ